MTIYKLAQLVEMSLDVPASEKRIAKRAILEMEKLSKLMDAFNTHLDILYLPFKNNENVSEESVLEYRASLRRYREKIEENFEEMKLLAAKAVKNLNVFATDTHVMELIKSFTDAFGDVEDTTLALLTALDQWQSKQYRDNVILSIELVKKQMAQVDKLIHDRIITHLNTNIIATNWVDSLSQNLESTVHENEPYVKRLHKERENQLNEMLKRR